jgi:ferredoxin
MAIFITSDCIQCGACEPECPNNAIYEQGAPWRWADGTTLQTVTTAEGTVEEASVAHTPLSEIDFYIVPGKCTECVGFHEEPQCAAVCPVDCCVDDPDHRESRELLLARKTQLHAVA